MAGVESVRLEGDEAAEIMEKGGLESLGGHSRDFEFFLAERWEPWQALERKRDRI